jgi:hypothetical protein
MAPVTGRGGVAMRPDQTMIGQGLHVWTGASGKKYRYMLYMFGTAFGPGAANFIYARQMKPGQHFPIYVGQTADLSEPISEAETTQCVSHNRPTHIHVRYNEAGEEDRLAEQSDLIAQLRPPCNRKG